MIDVLCDPPPVSDEVLNHFDSNRNYYVALYMYYEAMRTKVSPIAEKKYWTRTRSDAGEDVMAMIRPYIPGGLPFEEDDDVPMFVYDNPEIETFYERVRLITIDPDIADDIRRNELRVIQDEIGAETLSAILRTVPMYDTKTGEITTFDNYAKQLTESYSPESESPMDVDPIGATVKMLLDPSPETIENMTGVGQSNIERRQALDAHMSSQNTVKKILSGLFND